MQIETNKVDRIASGAIHKRIYIQIEGVLASPLSAGSGEAQMTDNDVIVDRQGNALVPGSTLAGAFRHFLSEGADSAGNQAIDELFGGKKNTTMASDDLHLGKQSQLMIYDMSLGQVSKGESAKIEIRDGVKLDAYKTAVDQGKYEIQVVETGTPFQIRLEWISREDANRAVKQAEIQQLLLSLIDGLYSGDLTLGAKSRRGFGKLKIQTIHTQSFDFYNNQQVLAWLVWNWGHDMNKVLVQDQTWKPNESSIDGLLDRKNVQSSKYTRIRVPLAIRHTLMIREYTSKGLIGSGQPDYEHMQMNGKAVIPGTSWTGAIRERLNLLLEEIGVGLEKRQSQLESLFGSRLEKESELQALKASRIRIEESVVEGGHPFTLTRNRIDRFTGGTVSGALYTMTPWVGGDTELILRWPSLPNDAENKVIVGLLLWVIRELQEGMLAVGGETAVGRGMFVGKNNNSVYLNEKQMNSEAIKQSYAAAIAWCQPDQEGVVAR